MPPSLEDYRWRIANIMIGGTTLRNQGAAGVERVARSFLAELDLAKFVSGSEAEFNRELDFQTEALSRNFPVGAQNWGAARKAINLFLSEAQYHRLVCSAYGLDKIEAFLEVPLDALVADYLWREAKKAAVIGFPRWDSIKRLTPPISKRYQDFASVVAKRKGPGWVRVHLDVVTWRRRETSPD